MHYLALRAASGAPAGRRLSRLVLHRDDDPQPVRPQHAADLVGHGRHRLLAALVDAEQRVERALVDAHVHARRPQPELRAVHHGVTHLGTGRAAELALLEHALLAEVDGDLVQEAVVVKCLREIADAAAGVQHSRPGRARAAQHVRQLGVAGKPLDVLVLGRQGVGLPELPRAEVGCRHLCLGREREEEALAASETELRASATRPQIANLHG